MVVDSSALVAILLEESEADRLSACLSQDPKRLISSVSLLESSIVLEARKGPAAGRELDLFIHAARLEIVPFNPAQAEIARFAYRTFGKGRHPAGLNLGDCCSYALAQHSGESLLCKGEDFPKTDVALARY